jgi:hypothetical protein
MADLFWPDVVEVQGAVLLARDDRELVIDLEYVLKAYGDLSGFEASSSETRVEDCVEGSALSPEEGLAVGLRVAQAWACRLRQAFPNYAFRVVVVHDGETTTLRFHRYRESEGDVYQEDLNVYGDHGVLVLSVP